MEEECGEILRLNLQKNRIDSLNGSFRIERIGLTGFRLLHRQDLLETIWIQGLRFWRALPTPKYILMDSYSELTDQLFIFGKRSFFANYKDVKHNHLQKMKIISLGLLETKTISSEYEKFFEEIYKIWGDNNKFNIYFVHFPYKFESRDLFIIRAKEIRSAIDELTFIFPNLISIVIPDELVTKQTNTAGTLDAFPYHFDTNAAKYVAQEIIKHEAALNGKV